MVDLSVDIGIPLKNPLILASGILGSSAGILRRVAEAGAGALITKSITQDPREGHENPTVIEVSEGVILNAIGLANPGVDAFIRELDALKGVRTPIIPSVAGNSEDEFATVASRFEDAGFRMVELNISCPHSLPLSIGNTIAQDPERTHAIVKTVKEVTSLRLIVKLSPNVTDIVEVAASAIDAGADAISLINTIEALEVDPWVEIPVLGNIFGGQSGPSIRCIAQRKLAEVALAMEDGKIERVPLIGVGGVRRAEDVFRFILLGADGVAIGSSILYGDIEIFSDILRGLEQMMHDKGYARPEEFRGKAISWIRTRMR
ncbi:MAG TPA: dihydroorotate dehydrogenase [Candidatus Syntrophoarchaeum butanivorans]|uniref:Dihydroorotate dehydrogenase n=1 Tax=Candidatus Syntropharchaeum butanivorans TaxID=1839936 RepID=A0A7C0X2W8_9EURY|nr:dihydroorotate dehydrogenase [Candidatus Syntrophoarchaeum butanivorans]